MQNHGTEGVKRSTGHYSKVSVGQPRVTIRLGGNWVNKTSSYLVVETELANCAKPGIHILWKPITLRKTVSCLLW